MKMNNTPTLQLTEERLKKLIRDKEDLDQMKADAQEMQKFRMLIVHENNDT